MPYNSTHNEHIADLRRSRRNLADKIEQSGFYSHIDGDWLVDLDDNKHFIKALLKGDYTKVGVMVCLAFDEEFEKHANIAAEAMA